MVLLEGDTKERGTTIICRLVSTPLFFDARLCGPSSQTRNEMTHQAQVELKLDLRHIVRLQSAAEPIRASTVSDLCTRYIYVESRTDN